VATLPYRCQWSSKRRADRVRPHLLTSGLFEPCSFLATNFVAPRHPGWCCKLVANPDTTVEIGQDLWQVRARGANLDEGRVLLGRIRIFRPWEHKGATLPVLVLGHHEPERAAQVPDRPPTQSSGASEVSSPLGTIVRALGHRTNPMGRPTGWYPGKRTARMMIQSDAAANWAFS
jgi:hypothetical protein